MEVGIIGNGRFGALMAKVLSEKQDYKVKIYSSKVSIDNKRFYSLDDVCNSDIVIPCVPISSFEEVMKRISPMLKKDCLVIDVCSVKVHPAKVMQDNLSKGVDILATHPMFGPDSTKDGSFFEDLKFIYSTLRVDNKKRTDDFLNLWRNLGCQMIKMTPEEHDEQAAYTHAFAFLIGKIGIMMNIRKNQITTKGFECLLYNQTAVENDSGQLFHDLQVYNPYTLQMRKEVLESLKEIETTF